MARNYPEHTLCKEFVKQIALLRFYKQFTKETIILHIANENIGNTKLQNIMRGRRGKEMGKLAGALDYLVLAEGFVGFMEAKRKKGEYGAATNGILSPEQKAFITTMQSIGVPCEVFNSVSSGEDVLIKWGLLKNRT